MNQLTQEQRKTLTGEQWKSKAFRGLLTANKCPKCEGNGRVSEVIKGTSQYVSHVCEICQGSGLPTIEVEKE